MLNVPRLDDLDYQKLFERARAAIPALTGDWTDFNDHDPGITTLQTFAWLCDNLNYFISATGEVHRLKYFKLLGIEPHMAPARCRVALSAPEGAHIEWTRGMRMAAGDVVFEAEKTLSQEANHLACLLGTKDGALFDLTAFAGADGSFATVFSGGPHLGEAVYLGFSQPMEGVVRLFIEVEENGRNPFDSAFHLVDLLWECAGGDGVWHRAALSADETGGLLKSGFVTLQLPCATAPIETGELPRACYLRLRLAEAENGYDLPPRIGRVLVNCAETVQTETWSQALFLPCGDAGILDIDFVIREGDRITVALEEPDGTYRLWYDSWSEGGWCALETGEFQWLRRIRFDADVFGHAPAPNTTAMVVITGAEAQQAVFLGETDGCAGQSLPFAIDDICELSLALLEQDEDGQRLRPLMRFDDLSLAGCDDWAFSYDAREECVVFGDSLHGIELPAGCQVVAVTIKTSRLEGGNVLAGQLNRLLDDAGPGLTCYNPENAFGGERMQSSEEMEPVLERRMRQVTRAVTANDLCALIKATPGLLIDSVAVIPMRDYCAATGAPELPNTVLAAVKPKSQQALPHLSETYRSAIRRHLEGFRLLTTDLKVLPARYVGVGVFGRIALIENNPAMRRQVLDELARLINGVDRGAFGQRIDFGRLFSALEILPAVRAVVQLSLEAIGEGGHKNEHGDVELHPDSLSYLRDTGIEFL